MAVDVLDWPITVLAGSWNPQYIVLRDPATEQPLDLTVAGYSARMVVATRSDGTGTVLADLADGVVFRRTAQGRLYFEPLPALTSEWVWRRGYHHIELARPDTTKPVRVAAGRITLSPELVI